MISSVSASELNEVEGNEHGQRKEYKFLRGTNGADQVDGHLRAKEISLQLPDEQHVRVHKRMSRSAAHALDHVADHSVHARLGRVQYSECNQFACARSRQPHTHLRAYRRASL